MSWLRSLWLSVLFWNDHYRAELEERILDLRNKS